MCSLARVTGNSNLMVPRLEKGGTLFLERRTHTDVDTHLQALACETQACLIGKVKLYHASGFAERHLNMNSLRNLHD